MGVLSDSPFSGVGQLRQLWSRTDPSHTGPCRNTFVWHPTISKLVSSIWETVEVGRLEDLEAWTDEVNGEDAGEANEDRTE